MLLKKKDAMKPVNPTRQKIIEIADELIYANGYERTSFAQIGALAQISKGNFYYHFKSKDEILDAVIGHRLEKTRNMLDDWDQQGSEPAERVKCYIRIVLQNWRLIRLHGCPVGTLVSELAKLDHPSRTAANKVFRLFRRWLAKQFSLIGNSSNADANALHILSWSQGVATMASAFRDKAFVEQEVVRICNWVDQVNAQRD